MELIKRLEVAKLFSINKSTLDRWVNPKNKYYRPEFPKPIKNGRTVVFVKAELEQYIEACRK